MNSQLAAPEIDTELSPNLRDSIVGLEQILSKVPGAVFGDSQLCPLKHSFAPGIYVREIFIPKGTVLTGKIHRHAHPNFLMKGKVIVVTEQGGREQLEAPMSMISAAGTKRAIIALEDTVWITVHATDETDLGKIEDYVIAKDYNDLTAELETKNCLILALKEMGRDYRCLLELEAKGHLLPFKKSLDKLRENGISIEGLSFEFRNNGEWHAAISAIDSPIDGLGIDDSDMVGSWAAVAVGGAALVGGVAGYLSTPGGSSSTPAYDPNMTALENEQLRILREQSAQQKMFQPLQAENAGYRPIYGSNPEALALQQKIADATARHGGDNDNPESMQLRVEFTNRGWDDYKWQHEIVGYEKTESRGEQDKQLQDLQGAQMATAQKANDALNKYLDSLNTDDYKAYQKAQQELQAQQTQIALQQGERTKKALAGELPLSKGTVDRKATDFQLLKENLARSGNAIIGDDPGSAYSLSSPGVQALKEFNTRYGIVEDAERQGALDTGSQAYLQSVGLSGNIGQNALSTTGQLSNPGGYASTSTSLTPNATPVQNNMNLIQGYSSAMTPYLQTQQLQNSNNQMNAQIDAQNKAGWLQLAGFGGGIASGALAGRK